MTRKPFPPTRLFVPAIMLLAAALACAVPGETNPNTAAATLDTAVQQTVAAGTPRPTVPVPPTLTPAPAINVTLQWPTDTPGPATLAPADTAQPAATSQPAAATPTVGALSRPGSEFHAIHFSTPPTIDGYFTDWGDLANTINAAVYRPENWTGPADNSAAFALGWDASALYLAIHVTDDAHVQTQLGALIFKGDSVELLLDSDLGGDFASATLSGDDYQIGFTPGENKIGGPDAYLWFPASQAGRPNATVSAHGDEGGGFYLEASIPWSVFNVAPSAGGRFGFAASVSDNDTPGTAEQQSMISTAPDRRLTNPTTWGTLVLDN